MKNQKGFALVLALVLLVVMSLMGGALIVVASGDHETNNVSDNYQQTFYVAETALLEGEKYLINQHLGPWKSDGTRDKRNINPVNQKTAFSGLMERKNYNTSMDIESNKAWYLDTKKKCFNSFTSIKQDDFYVVTAESNNFGILLNQSLTGLTKKSGKDGDIEAAQLEKMKKFYYEFFISRGGSASFTGTGSSIKKTATDATNLGISYKIYGCGIYAGEDRMVVALESSVVLPRQ